MDFPPSIGHICGGDTYSIWLRGDQNWGILRRIVSSFWTAQNVVLVYTYMQDMKYGGHGINKKEDLKKHCRVRTHDARPGGGGFNPSAISNGRANPSSRG